MWGFLEKKDGPSTEISVSRIQRRSAWGKEILNLVW